MGKISDHRRRCTTDDAVVVYWAYPEGTDENTEFHLVHYVGLDRNSNTDLGTGQYTMDYYSIGAGLETTEQGIRFTVESFSPFALFWEDDNNNGGGGSSGGGGGGGGGGDSKPELNKEDAPCSRRAISPVRRSPPSSSVC